MNLRTWNRWAVVNQETGQLATLARSEKTGRSFMSPKRRYRSGYDVVPVVISEVRKHPDE